MARKRKYRRKTHSTARTGGKVAGKTRKFGGKRYSRKSCYGKKSDAKKAAKNHRSKSKSAKARVVAMKKQRGRGKKYCVYTYG